MAGATYMTGVGANDTLWSNNQGFGRVEPRPRLRRRVARPRRPDAGPRRDGRDVHGRAATIAITGVAVPRRARVDRRARPDDRQRLREQPRPRGHGQRHALPRQRVLRRELDHGRHRRHAQQHRVRVPAGRHDRLASRSPCARRTSRATACPATPTRPTRTSRWSSTTGRTCAAVYDHDPALRPERVRGISGELQRRRVGRGPDVPVAQERREPPGRYGEHPTRSRPSWPATPAATTASSPAAAASRATRPR